MPYWYLEKLKNCNSMYRDLTKSAIPTKYVIVNVCRPPNEMVDTFNIFVNEFDMFLNNLSKMNSLHTFVRTSTFIC